MAKYQAIKTAEDVDKVICATFGLTQYGRVLESSISDTCYGIYFEANRQTLKKLGLLGITICMLDVLLASYTRMYPFQHNLKELIVACKIGKDVHFIRTKSEFLAFLSLTIQTRADITDDVLNDWIRQSQYSVFPAKKFNFKEEIER